MSTIVVRPLGLRSTPTPPPSHGPTLNLNTKNSEHVPVPNKHIPICSPGEPPHTAPATPPSSPPTNKAILQTSSLLFPPDQYPVLSESPNVRALTAKQLTEALDHLSTQPLPDAGQVFPWLHGLHPDNHIQLGFFVARRRSLRKTPNSLRSITIIKAARDLGCSRLKGAVTVDEIIPHPLDKATGLLEVDPRDGFSVRNFQIQVGKIAQVSDLVVYGDETTSREEVLAISKDVAQAQEDSRRKSDPTNKKPQLFHTFMVTCPFTEFEKTHPELVSVDSKGQLTGRIMDFFHWERLEMCIMSQASQIGNNVWLGSTADTGFDPTAPDISTSPFDVLIEASDCVQSPDRAALDEITKALDQTGEPQLIDFPSSGSVMPSSWPQRDAINIIETCQWIYDLANPKPTASTKEGGVDMDDSDLNSRRVLIYCMDGYTETSLLALSYTMFSEGLFADEAWIRLHKHHQRNFFAYASDLAFLRSIQTRLLQAAAPRVSRAELSITPLSAREPAWVNQMDGSLPSRILPYMYLGNLGHANNPGLLKTLGIKRVLSIGETVSWDQTEIDDFGNENLVLIGRVQDNGVDELTSEFERCLDFISK
jgi:dual specificity MAP kinase phosphatase